jgi:chromosome segregation ATPase
MTDNPAVDPGAAGTPPTETPPAQPPPAEPVTTPSGPPDGFIEIARYNGLVKKVETLTLANRELEAQITGKTSEIEQLNSQIALKDTEKTVAVNERDKQLETSMTENQSLQAELKELRGLKLKLEVAKDLNRPELVNILDRLPNLEDKEALTTVAEDFLGFADDLVQQREEQLTSGITPPVGPINETPATPSTPAGWETAINSEVLGSPERAKLMDDYGDWLEQQNANQT